MTTLRSEIALLIGRSVGDACVIDRNGEFIHVGASLDYVVRHKPELLLKSEVTTYLTPLQETYDKAKALGAGKISFMISGATGEEIEGAIQNRKNYEPDDHAVRIGMFKVDDHVYYEICDTSDELENHPEFITWVTDPVIVNKANSGHNPVENSILLTQLQGFVVRYRTALVNNGGSVKVVSVSTPKQVAELNNSKGFLGWLDDWQEVTV